MTLFRSGEFTLHSGERSDYIIDCNALTDDDLETIALLLAKRVPPFNVVRGIPRGGLRLAAAMERYVTPRGEYSLFVDDVYTTGASLNVAMGAFQEPVIGAVIFARRRTPFWIIPLFVVDTVELNVESAYAAYKKGRVHDR